MHKSTEIDKHYFQMRRRNTNFISLLTTHLRGIDHHVEVSRGDADTLIVSSALEFARNGQTITVVTTDTDVLIMLVYHWRNCMEDIFIRKESRLSTPGEMISMKEATSSIPVVIQRHILLIHAWSGCDTTSATFGHGKMYLMKMLNWVPEVQNLSTIVSDRDAPADEVGYAGLRPFCLLYGGTKTDTLTSLHYARYMTMMAKSNKVMPQRLPPTERAAHYHSLRVHLQVIRWTVLSNDMLQANEWGWKMTNNFLCPVMTDLDAAPAKFLQFIRCMCKSTGKNPCGTKQCSCHKNGLRCLMACNEWRGQSCNNTDMTMHLDVHDDDHHHDGDAEGNLDVWKGHQMTARHMVCYFWIRASYVIMLSYFQVAKKVLLHLCPAAGYLA